ncbi:hypothetical protein [Paracoccus sp. (in: a-proteobacteria)]|uniref:hypothetical protein n=1 Tax=Paracoccus sp. TaxID=267 RepID=UPI0028AF8640|nr:hypothetical protein [Paracoccus sp. (in: a-proteobacteria)]
MTAYSTQGRRISQARQKSMIVELTRLVQAAFKAGKTGSLWGLEGPLRAALRADLCRKSWRWSDADAATRALLEAVFMKAGAERPDWYEGQPEWTIEAGTLIERTRCVRCHAPLPEGHFKFCSRLCNTSHASWLARMRQASEDQAVYMAVNSG